MRRLVSDERPTIVELQMLCQRVRLAGAPGGPPRSALLAEYRRLAVGLGLEPVEVETGRELQRASVDLLKLTSAANRAAEPAATPRRRTVTGSRT